MNKQVSSYLAPHQKEQAPGKSDEQSGGSAEGVLAVGLHALPRQGEIFNFAALRREQQIRATQEQVHEVIVAARAPHQVETPAPIVAAQPATQAEILDQPAALQEVAAETEPHKSVLSLRAVIAAALKPQPPHKVFGRRQALKAAHRRAA